MKTKYWIAVLLTLALVCAALTFWLFAGTEKASGIEIWSGGKLVSALPLDKDRTITIQNGEKENVITIRDGAVAVTWANCPDGHCKQRGFCTGGAQIVCLPNELVIKFVGEQTVDGVVG